MSEDFRIEWTRTGGFAGLARTVTVDAADLAPEDRAAVAALLDRVTNGPAPARGADRFVHELAITRGGTTRRITVHDGAVPGPAAELLRRLRERPERAGGAG